MRNKLDKLDKLDDLASSFTYWFLIVCGLLSIVAMCTLMLLSLTQMSGAPRVILGIPMAVFILYVSIKILPRYKGVFKLDDRNFPRMPLR